MAKKTEDTGSQNSSIITNVFIKGMNKDTDSSYFDVQKWYHARNAVNNSIDGDVGVIGNEPANQRCAKISYTIIGAIHLYGDIWVVYSTNNVLSEIGLFDDSKCTYSIIINDSCLNFNQDHLITGAAKENFDCTWQVYWDDGFNPSRTLNISNVPYIMIDVTPVGSTCVVYERALPNRLDCEKIRLAPFIDVPCVTLSKGDSGGLLENGSYQVFIAYTINDITVTDYIGISNIQPLWSHEDTQGSLTIRLSNVDKNFEWITVVIRSRIKGQPSNKVLGVYSTESTVIDIDYINRELPDILSSDVQRRNPAYEKSDGMWVVNDYLMRSQPTEQFDFNYQPLANQINTYWTATSFPSNYYNEGGNKPTLLRDEQYSFFIRFIYNTGEKSSSYHIPGRSPQLFSIPSGGGTVFETDPMTTLNFVNADDKIFNGYNTANSLGSSNPFLASLIGTTTDDGGIIINGGQMGYWESSEVYSPTDPLRWGSLCGQNIRHHKIPDERVPGAGTSLTSQTAGSVGDRINVLGVAFDNIPIPLYNDGTIIPNIVGYEILVGSRAGHRSILAKGILKNMFRFRTNVNDPAPGNGLMPNYPYNDLRQDPYLVQRDKGSTPGNTLTFLGNLGTLGLASIESNWLRGSESGPYDNKGLQAISEDTFTFHSPELNFSRLYLNPNEVQIYKTIRGKALGKFKKSEDHPKNKLLKNRSATVAAIIGTGYALMEMRGKVNRKMNTMQSNTHGHFGVYAVGTGEQLDATPGIGTASGAANVASTGPGLAWGYVADLALGSVVDIGAALGGGKEAKRIGLPVYNAVEATATALSAGHIGPNRSIEYEGSEFDSVPTALAVLVGIISFLNKVAIGGDKVIDLILNLMSYQDHAYKYISHGYYKDENVFLGPQWRKRVDKSRYIKQGIQSFDGSVIVQNLLRPSTVVVKIGSLTGVAGNWVSSFIISGGTDNTKFTIGNNFCAGDGNDQMNWYSLDAEVTSTCAVNYAAFKVGMDNQYGQIEQIIQLNTQGCYNFASQQNVDANGVLIPFIPGDVFSTDTVYAGDSYISRYTEKTIMPFFYNFMKEGPDGVAFDYSKYANVPFPRYWMNTEKFRMDEFIRPITNLSFNWSNSTEALPTAYYNLDTPNNGGYCTGITIPPWTDSSSADDTSGGMDTGSGIFSNTGGVTLGNKDFYINSADPLNDPTQVSNLLDRPINRRYEVIGPLTGTNLTFSIDTSNPATPYEVFGQLDSLPISQTPPSAGAWATSETANLSPFLKMSCTHPYNTIPVYDNTSISIGVGNPAALVTPATNPFEAFLKGSYSANIPNMFSHDGGIYNCKVLYDWYTNTIMYTVSNAVAIGTLYSNTAPLPIANSSSVEFRSNVAYNNYISLGVPSLMTLNDKAFNTNLSPSNPFFPPSTIQTTPETIIIGGSSGSGANEEWQTELEATFTASSYSQPSSNKADGGLFVLKTGYMYTHNCGINDFWVESSINLAYRDWEEPIRKRHYDNELYSDLVSLFHAKEIEYDNYYFYDRSTSVDKFWGSSWGQVQERWYNPLIAETCFIKYPKRLLYSAPATGWQDKAASQSKNDVLQDFWRVYLKENFRDFKAKITTIKPINQTGAIIFFPTLSPQVFKGQDTLELTHAKITIGDGGLFRQAFQNLANSDISHEYGSCENARSVLNTPYGIYFASQAQGKIFHSDGSGITAISDMGMKWWFNKYLPSKLLEFFPEIEDCPQAIDNPVIAAGLTTVYDPNSNIVYFTKRDYIPVTQYLNNNCIQYIPCEGFVYNLTECTNAAQIATCPPGYTLIVDPITLQNVCQYQYTGNPNINQTVEYTYGIAIGNGTFSSYANYGNIRFGRDMPIVIDDVALNGLPSNPLDPSTWHYITPNGLNGFWRNGLANTSDGIVNRLMRGANSIPLGTFATFEFKVTIPTQKTVHILLAADNGFELSSGTPMTPHDDIIVPDDALLFAELSSGGIWNAQTIANGNFNWLSSSTANSTQYSKAWIYKINLQAGCTEFIIKGTNEAEGPAGLAAAIIDVDNWLDLQNATSWDDLPKLWDSETSNFMIAGTTTLYDCEDGYQQYTDGTDGSTDKCPVCRLEDITSTCDCEIDFTSGLPGTLIGNDCNTAYCIYEGYVNPVMVDQTVPIDVTNSSFFKDISWTISYDPKSKAWISFHDWHPDLSFNSINHFLTSKTEMTTVPQCPPDFTWNGTECCQSFNEQFVAEVTVDEFIASEVLTAATVEAFTETMDFVMVIDFSTSMNLTNGNPDSRMDAAMEFCQAFITGMSPGMLGGAYAGQVRIGHGRWGDGTAGSGNDPGVIMPTAADGNGTWVTDDPVVALQNLTQTPANSATNYDPQSGTNFNDGIDLANTMLTGSTATQRIVIFISDAGQAPNNPTNLTNATQLIALKVDGATNADACDPTDNTNYAENYSTLVTGTNLPSVPAYNVVRCAANGPLIRNMYHIGSGIAPGNEGHTGQVAADIVAAFTNCNCTQGVLDAWIANPPCLPLPSPPPQCLECFCPDGYTMVGNCNDSSNLPFCRKMNCECPSPFFNVDETVTISGYCDDIFLWYNSLTGTGDPNYVNNDPLFCSYSYQLCYPANYEIGYFWKHNVRTDLFNNYYDINYPWEIDVIQQTGQQVTTIRSIEYQMEAYLYQNDSRDRFHDLDYNFDEAIIYNSEQVSGLLNLILEPKNNIQLSVLYPIVNINSIDVLFSKVEQKYRFNQFWDITNDRGEFTTATNNIFNNDWDGYTRDLNLLNLNYSKPQQQRKKFRHYYNHILLRRSAIGATTRKMLLKLENIKLNISSR